MRNTPFSGAPILNSAVHCMCAWHMPRRNFVLNRLPYDLVNVAVKLEFWSLDLASPRVHVFGPTTCKWHSTIQARAVSGQIYLTLHLRRC